MFVKQRYAGALLAVIAAFGLASCDVAPQEQEAPALPQVSVLTLTGRELVISEDLPARVAALRSADIRAQISGIVQRRLFEQGAEISAGTVLFQINPAPFKADVDSAAAALQRAEAVLARARIQIDRLRPLLRTDAISRQTYDDLPAGSGGRRCSPGQGDPGPAPAEPAICQRGGPHRRAHRSGAGE